MAYKGRTKTSLIERDFPHHVELIVPAGGLGKRLDAMYDFHTQHSIPPQRGHGRHSADGSVIRWCFADHETADAFRREFIRS